jgi:quinol monooxygenase YgiN
MVALIATVYGKESESKRLLEALMELGRKTRREKGNLSFHMHQKQDDPSTYIFYETYADEEAFAAHLGAEHSKEFERLFNDLKLGRAKTEIVRLSRIEL